MAVIVGAKISGIGGPLHVFLGVMVATLGGALWGGIAGFLKATVGAHEVITTIMLNWIAIWSTDYLFGLSGPLQSTTQQFNPVSDDIHESAKLPVFWGDPVLQGLHIGLFISLALLGRNTAIGIFFSSLLFAALTIGTSTRQLDPDVFDPKLATNLTLIIQGLIVLFIGANVLILYLWRVRHGLPRL